MGDIVSFVEKAALTIDANEARKIAEKMRKGRFDLDDLAAQLAQVEKIGGVGGILGMLPGVGKIKEQMAAANFDGKMIARQRAIILSMTPKERRNPDLLKASRKKRIAAGSGSKVEDVNKLLKQHRQMADMMKAMGGASARSPLGKMASMFGMGGGGPTPEQIEQLQKQAGSVGGLPKLPPAPPGLSPFGPKPPGLPGLGGPKPSGLPGLGGVFNPFGKKK
jgi:signal recognition particle subunit SRP54